MSCANKKCSKEIISSFNCNKCSFELCSNKCLIEHMAQDHKGKHPRIPVKMPSKRSIFNLEGKLLKEFIDDPLYNFKNFEFVRTQTNKIQTIGSGAFGNVFLSKNIKDNKLYAIKHIRKSKLIAAGESLDIVYREISIHRLLLHDNIIRLYSHNEDEDNIFMVLEYADSGTLFHLIRKKGGLDEAEAFKYFIQSATAVAFLHENGFAHRDLKPENLLLTQEGNQIKLCDFGWCVDTSSGERGTFCGTYEYMAPEIVKEVPYDKSIDSWSLGILLYELIHGYSPFRAEKEKGDDKFQEIFKNIIKHKYAIEKDIGKACADLISKLLTPDHNQRLKVKEIFKHPWVTEFESDKEMKEWITERKRVHNNNDDDSIAKNSSVFPINDIDNNENKNKNKNDFLNDNGQLNKGNDSNDSSRNKSKNKIIITKKKSSNKDIFNFIENKHKKDNTNSNQNKDNNSNNNNNNKNNTNVIIKKLNINKNDKGKEKERDKDSEKRLDCKAKISEQQPVSVKASEADFSLFEDKVFEDTLKMIDKKQKRKVKNEIESDEIRISKTKQNPNDKNDFFLFNNSHNNNNNKEDLYYQINSRDNKSNSREKTSAESQNKSVKSKEDIKMSQFNKDNDQSEKEKEKKKKKISYQEYITNDGSQGEANQMPIKGDHLLQALDILEKAQNLQDKSSIKPIVQPAEENFWDKVFAPFKCGNNNP